MFPMRLVLFFVVLMSYGFDHAVSKIIPLSRKSQSQQQDSSKNIQEPQKFCLTKTCNDTAFKISNAMDSTEDPCEDFYQFTCGRHRRYSDGFRWGVGDDLIYALEGPVKQDEPKPLKMVKQYFQSCMDDSPLKNKSVESLLQVVKSFGGWPIIEGDKWNETNFNWIELIAELQKLGYVMDNMPEIMDRQNLFENPKTLKRTPIRVLLPRDANIKTIDIIHEDVVNIIVGFGADRTFAKKEVRDLFSFVSKLNDLNDKRDSFETDEFHQFDKTFKHSFTDEEYQMVMEDHSYEIAYREVQKLNLTIRYPFTNGVYLNIIKSYAYEIADRELKKTAQNSSHQFTEMIERLIGPFMNIKKDTDIKWQLSLIDLKSLMWRTSKRVQANYIIWSTIFQSELSFNSHITEMYAKLVKDSGLPPKTKVRIYKSWECPELCEKFMPRNLYALLIRTYFNGKLKNDNMKILENIQKEVIKNVDGATWLSPKMKDIYRDKIEKLTFFVAYKGDYFNDTELENWDKDLNISSSNNFWQNHISLQSSLRQKSYDKFDENEKLPRELWKLLDSSASYDSDLNTIIIPFRFFQSTLNEVENPEYIKYGAAGALMGHEFYRALDCYNRNYDGSHQKINFDNPTEEIFHQLDQCIINQYSNISRGGITFDSQHVLDVHFADIGGFKAAYQAYSHLASQKNESELSLLNLPYTPKQMFWISALNPFCFDRHFGWYHSRKTLLDIRYTKAFSNIPEFARDFKCRVGSKMNPEKKCIV